MQYPQQRDDAAATILVNVVLDPASRYSLVADQLLKQVPWRHWANRGHWLCRLLSEASKTFAPSTYINMAKDALIETLKKSGLPPFAASIVGEALAMGARRVIGAFTTDHLILALRALVLCVCPNFGQCPVQDEILPTLLEPGVEEAIKTSLG